MSIALLPEDEEYLNSHHSDKWRMESEGEAKFGLIIDGFRLPRGYEPTEATLMLIVPSGYPGAQIDMFYFVDPGITKSNGKIIPALEKEPHFGRSWQRWSRHYLQNFQWNPGEDNIAKHIQFVLLVLTKEADQ